MSLKFNINEQIFKLLIFMERHEFHKVQRLRKKLKRTHKKTKIRI